MDAYHSHRSIVEQTEEGRRIGHAPVVVLEHVPTKNIGANGKQK